MPSIDDYLRQLEDEARRQGATPEESWRADLGRTYQGSGGQGARSTEDIYRSLYEQQAARGRDTAPREEDRGGGGGGGSSGGGYDLRGVPLPNLPRFEKPPPFQHDPYTSGLSLPTFNKPDPYRLPSVDEMLQDPSYKWRKGQGEDSLQRWAAAKGTLNDSSTATSLIDYGQSAAAQEYGAVAGRGRDAYLTNYQTQNVDPYRFAYQGALDTEDRRFQTYMANRAGALTQYNTNYGTQYVDPYRFEYQRESDLFAPQMAEWEAGADFRNLRFGTDAAERMQGTQLGYTDEWNRFLADLEDKRWQKDFEFRVTSQD